MIVLGPTFQLIAMTGGWSGGAFIMIGGFSPSFRAASWASVRFGAWATIRSSLKKSASHSPGWSVL
jgi:hypothetical protein